MLRDFVENLIDNLDRHSKAAEQVYAADARKR
jgi:hypothetical protein